MAKNTKRLSLCSWLLSFLRVFVVKKPCYIEICPSPSTPSDSSAPAIA
jgi:hypothetical protein